MYLKKTCVAGCTTCCCGVMVIITLVLHLKGSQFDPGYIMNTATSFFLPTSFLLPTITSFFSNSYNSLLPPL